MRQFLRALIIFILLFSSAYLLYPLILPIFFGLILLPVMYPLYLKILKTKKINVYLASFITINLYLGVVIVPGALIGVHGAKITANYLNSIQFSGASTGSLVEDQKENVAFLEGFSIKLQNQFGFEILPIDKLIQENLKKVAGFLLGSLTQVLRALPDFFLGYFIVLFILFFGLVESESLKKFLSRHTLLNEVRSKEFMNITSSACRSVIISNVLTGITQALIVGLGAAITRSGDFFVISFITFIFSFVPIVGAAPIAIILAIYQFTVSNYIAGIAMVGVGVIAGLSDNFLRPILLKGPVDIHPFISLLFILGGVITFGLPGLFIGPLVITIVKGLTPLYFEEFKSNKS